MTVQFLEYQSSNLQVGSLSALLGKMTTRYVAKIRQRRRHILHNPTRSRYRCGNSSCIGCWLWMKMVDIECKPCASLWHRGLAGEVAPRTTLAAFHSRASGNTAALLRSGKTLFSLLRALSFKASSAAKQKSKVCFFACRLRLQHASRLLALASSQPYLVQSHPTNGGRGFHGHGMPRLDWVWIVRSCRMVLKYPLLLVRALRNAREIRLATTLCSPDWCNVSRLLDPGSSF